MSNLPFNPANHYWCIDNAIWSSAAKAYVPKHDDAFLAWADLGGVPTKIASEAELRETLAAAGFPKLAPGYAPASVYMWQAKTAIAAIGLLEEADNAIDASNNPALLLAWHTAPEISRASPAVAAIGATLGLSAKQVDDLFIQAESFKV